MRFFDEPDADLFCGRDEQVNELLQKLAQSRLVTVIGPSGCGKSSLVRAGLIPAIRKMQSWRIVSCRPGGNPIGELTAALERSLSYSGAELTLRRGRLGLVEAVQPFRLEGQNFLLIIDQFEELFRFQHDRASSGDAVAFVKLILEAAQPTTGIYVVVTMRSDYLGDCSRFRDLPERINQGLYLVPRMRREQLEEAITAPLRVTGDPIAPRLTERLLNDVGDDPDQLPVLEHVLLRTWTRWGEVDRGPMDLAHYQAVGGLDQALEVHANQIWEALAASGQKIAEKLFRRLTVVDENRAIRSPDTFQELVEVCGGEAQREEVRAVIDAFRTTGASFLMPDDSRVLEPSTVIDITHESLIRQWSKLREWAQQEHADSGVYIEIAKRAEQAAGPEDNLTGGQLARAAAWLDKGLNASWASRYKRDYEGTVGYIRSSQQAAADAVKAVQRAGINAAWSFYRKCAATSAYHKNQLERFTRVSLWLGIAAAIIGTVGQVVAPDPKSVVSKVAGIAGSVVVALAGVAATQATASGRDKRWVNTRAAGEAIKSAVYLYCAGVPPFDTADRTTVLAGKVEKARTDLQGLELHPETPRDPPGWLSVTDYIKVRIDDQVSYYVNLAVKYQERADFWRFSGLIAASSGAVLGAASVMYSLAPWVALLSTIVTSVTAYVKSQQYQSLIALYQATASRLSLLKDSWLDSAKGDSDTADRNAFISNCEDTMALENGAWVAKWAEHPPAKPPEKPAETVDAPASSEQT